MTKGRKSDGTVARAQAATVSRSLLPTLMPGAVPPDERDRALHEELQMLHSVPADNTTHREYPADFVGPLLPRDSYSPIPVHPPGADVDANMKEAADMFPNPWAFRNAVKNKGKWDYKQLGKQYQHFGNFNYGAAGHAWGFSDTFLLRKAGEAQIEAGTSRPEWQPGGGNEPPYGDDPEDQKWIQRGIDYAKKMRKPGGGAE